MVLTNGVELRLFNGHTVGQIAVYVKMAQQTLVYCGDVIPLAANVPVAWLSSYDIFPLDAMTDKQRMLEEAAEKQQILLFEHDAYTECCMVEKQYNKFKVSKTLRFEDIC